MSSFRRSEPAIPAQSTTTATPSLNTTRRTTAGYSPSSLSPAAAHSATGNASPYPKPAMQRAPITSTPTNSPTSTTIPNSASGTEPITPPTTCSAATPSPELASAPTTALPCAQERLPQSSASSSPTPTAEFSPQT